MQRPYRVAWLLPVLAVALAADPLGADDRNLLRDVSAPPNILIVFDSSGSMIGTPESGPVRRPYPSYGMNPGSGDDPRSRMGIAKDVLTTFLNNATNINFAFAQYAQSLPEVQPIYQKHWVYEALGTDRFRIVEPGYAFRVGFNTDFTGGGLIDPADLATDVMIGEKVQYADASAVESRYGPITVATLLGDPQLYDKMPIYFGDPNRFVFPGSLADPWSHGTYDTTTMEQRFRRCTADQVDSNGDGTPDDPDACKATWFESLSSVRTRQWQRQARLEMQPDQSWLAVDRATGLPVGNHHVAGRHGVTDYNADGSADNDIDKDNDYDWIMYVDLVEQRRSRDCDATPSGFPTWTPTPTQTATVTETPTATPTETPIPASCDDLGIKDALTVNSAKDSMIVDLFNHADIDAYIIATHFEWEPESPTSYIDWFKLNWTGHNYDTGDYSSSPVDASYGYPGTHPDYRLLPANTNDTRLRTRVQNQSLDPPVGDWLISLTFYYPSADLTCTITSSTSIPTPTPTASATPTPPCTLDGDGLLGVYYLGRASFSNPIGSIDGDLVDYDWYDGAPSTPPGMPADNFTVRWTGDIRPEVAGLWNFCLWSDDGGLLEINGTKVIDDWGDHAARYRCGQINMTYCTRVPIKVDFYENGGQARIKLFWAPPGSAYTEWPGSLSGEYGIVPRPNLYQTDSPPATVDPDCDPDDHAHPDHHRDADEDLHPVEHANVDAHLHPVEHADDHQHPDAHQHADADQHPDDHADAVAYQDADDHADAVADRYANCDADGHLDADENGDADPGSTDEHADGHADDHADVHAVQHADADQNADPADGDQHGDQNADPADGYEHADADQYTDPADGDQHADGDPHAASADGDIHADENRDPDVNADGHPHANGDANVRHSRLDGEEERHEGHQSTSPRAVPPGLGAAEGMCGHRGHGCPARSRACLGAELLPDRPADLDPARGLCRRPCVLDRRRDSERLESGLGDDNGRDPGRLRHLLGAAPARERRHLGPTHGAARQRDRVRLWQPPVRFRAQRRQ